MSTVPLSKAFSLASLILAQVSESPEVAADRIVAAVEKLGYPEDDSADIIERVRVMAFPDITVLQLAHCVYVACAKQDYIIKERIKHG